MRPEPWVLALLLLPLAAGRLEAQGGQSCTSMDSLVPDCGFEAGDLAAWTIGAGDASLVSGNCASGSGCLRLLRNSESNAVEVIGGCVALDPSALYGFGVASLQLSGPFELNCSTSLWTYSSADCDAGFLSSISRPFGTDTIWLRQLASGETPATTASGKIRISCTVDDEFGLRFDDVVLVPAVFIDGFESGNLSAWFPIAPS
jgi:hypothetical protein